MKETPAHGFDRANALVAAMVWLFSFIIYLMTQAATFSLWDCGEFVAVTTILGIPHPPGTPLYVLVGHIFSMLPLFQDPGARINFMSAFCNSVAVMFGYLIGVRILRKWFIGDATKYTRALIYLGAASGALFLGFGRTAWTNGIEAEVYAMSMMLMLAILWLTLIYLDRRGTPSGDRVMLTVVFLAFLGIGVHMTTFLILPVSAIAFILHKDTPTRYWFLLAAVFALVLYLIFAMSQAPEKVPTYVPLVIVLVFYLFYILSFDAIPRPHQIIAAGLTLASLPILSLLHPALKNILSVIAVIGYVATLAYACYLTYRYLAPRGEGAHGNRQNVTAALFVFAGGLMALVLELDVTGYAAYRVVMFALLAVAATFIWRYVRLPILVVLVGVSLVMIGIKPFFYGSLVAIGVTLLLGLAFKARYWVTGLLIIVMAVLGFSVHLYIPIRSSKHPAINENNPSQDLISTIYFLERKQYGMEGMVERMFTRRAHWENQFGSHERMGFWHFFNEQYGLTGPRFFVLFVLGLFGIWEALRRRSQIGILFTILFLVSSIGLVLYMNFADGTQMLHVGRDHLEVRDRDYFFTPGFMLFGLAIGLGIAAFVQFIRESTARFSTGPRRFILVALLLFFALPGNAIARNWFYCDRSENRIPYEYAWDLLHSVKENAVMFTGGDNDTFSLWCLQQAYGVRKDVRVINLALANSKWYMKQARENLGLKLPWTDAQIDNLRPYRLDDGRVFKLQDILGDAIIEYNPDVPVNWSVTVRPSERRYRGHEIDSLLALRGMALYIDTAQSGPSLSADLCQEYFMDSSRFVYSSMADHSFYHREAIRRVTGNVARSIIEAANVLRQAGRFEAARGIVKKGLAIVPGSSRTINVLASLYMETNDIDSIRMMPELYPQADQAEIQLALAQAYRRIDQPELARPILDSLLQARPSWRPALDEMMRLLVQAHDGQAIVQVLRRWLEHNPDDVEIRQALDELMKQLEQGDSVDN
jgi:tetratricopeptide (TPR) repeat protein